MKTSAIVAIGVPLTSAAHLAQNGRFVYSLYQIKLEEAWKDERKKRKGQAADQVMCGTLGGSVRFLSGHVGTFLEADEGFLKLGARYVLFLWQPIPHDQTYTVDATYLLQGDKVFPVDVSFGRNR